MEIGEVYALKGVEVPMRGPMTCQALLQTVDFIGKLRSTL